MIIPVLDIKNGEAVSGKSGMRETYKPLKTVFTDSSDPLKIAVSLKDAGAQRMYIADLDAIEGKGSNLNVIKEINRIIPVMFDAGANDVRSVAKTLNVASKAIVATETLHSFEDLDEIFESFEKDKLIVSIDIKNNHILSKYMDTNFDTLINKIADLKPDEIILLDISRVGTEKGVDQGFIDRLSKVETSIIIGGGIRDEDIDVLSKSSVEKFLVGSALHKGKIRHSFQ
ncbi:MAG: HisA/HisF family protein [Methanobacterium paludis]|uniref:HisA/hisF family protein n=1 Tax=Methanobacterium paludis (strain DSM 25820 / JCM 18151 / SWAN1) TaxID=868131 RepID=F6D4M4_METPW|nr:HisA/HisF family protein [Methanobacterium paludis]AEG17509.1 hisA/hisF family protein [Methanobacterium paludis]MCE7698859.1 HisA/HisF family protein [Methanobacterium paludis]